MLPTVDAILTMAAEVDNGTRISTARCPASSCRDMLKFGFIKQVPSAYARDMCGGVAAYVAEQGAQFVDGTGFESTGGVVGEPYVNMLPETHTVDEAKAVLTQLRDAGANVLMVCTNTVSATQIVEAQEALDYAPLHTAALNSNTGAGWPEDVRAGWWQGEFWGSPTTWAPTSSVWGEFTGLTAQNFTSRYRGRFSLEPTSNDAAAFATLTALSAAIEAAGSISTNDVHAAMEALDIQEFFVPTPGEYICHPSIQNPGAIEVYVDMIFPGGIECLNSAIIYSKLKDMDILPGIGAHPLRRVRFELSFRSF